jgi:hypothetical protein
MTMEMNALAVALPRGRHPNRLPFRGVLAPVDVPSDRAPEGARGHRVALSREAAERALPSLLGMALDYLPALDGHDARRKVGIITEAEIADPSFVVRRPSFAKDENRTTSGALVISGYLYARDFPELVRELRSNAGALGLSYEITEAKVADMRAAIWVLSEVTFTGAAILRREKAAYRSTSIELTEEPRDTSFAVRPSSFGKTATEAAPND